MPLSFHKTKRLEIRGNIKSKSMTLQCSIDTKARDDIKKGRDDIISKHVKFNFQKKSIKKLPGNFNYSRLDKFYDITWGMQKCNPSSPGRGDYFKDLYFIGKSTRFNTTGVLRKGCI